jgi:hypothetical protein
MMVSGYGKAKSAKVYTGSGAGTGCCPDMADKDE